MKVYGRLINRIKESDKQPEPQIDMGATVSCYSDREVGTIIEITAESITVQEDAATRTDNFRMSDCQSYDYAPNPKGRTWTFKRNQEGVWRNGSGDGLILGERDKYVDFGL